MKTYKIAVVEGDGIGPEVVACGIEVLERGSQRLVGGFDLEFLPAPAGAGLTWNAARTCPPRRWRPAARPTPSSSAPAACPTSATPTAPS